MTFKEIKDKMENILNAKKEDSGKILILDENGKIKLVSPKDFFAIIKENPIADENPTTEENKSAGKKGNKE